MVACVFVRADDVALRLCRQLGLRMKRGATAVFGLLGPDAARLFDSLDEHQRAWLAVPCGPRETKVLLVARGLAVLSIETADRKVAMRAI